MSSLTPPGVIRATRLARRMGRANDSAQSVWPNDVPSEAHQAGAAKTISFASAQPILRALGLNRMNPRHLRPRTAMSMGDRDHLWKRMARWPINPANMRQVRNSPKSSAPTTPKRRLPSMNRRPRRCARRPSGSKRSAWPGTPLRRRRSRPRQNARLRRRRAREVCRIGWTARPKRAGRAELTPRAGSQTATLLSAKAGRNLVERRPRPILGRARRPADVNKAGDTLVRRQAQRVEHAAIVGVPFRDPTRPVAERMRGEHKVHGRGAGGEHLL